MVTSDCSTWTYRNFIIRYNTSVENLLIVSDFYSQWVSRSLPRNKANITFSIKCSWYHTQLQHYKYTIFFVTKRKNAYFFREKQSLLPLCFYFLISFIVGIVRILPHFGHRGCLISTTIPPGTWRKICPQRIHRNFVICTIIIYY